MIPAKRTQSFAGCARCDGDGHDDLEFTAFTNPVVVEEHTFNYWAPCPVTGEPILLEVKDVEA